MRPARLRGWIQKYGMGGLLLAGGYLGWRHLSTKQRAALLAGILAAFLLCAGILFRHQQVASIPKSASNPPTVEETGVNRYLELRRNMTLATISGSTDTNSWRVKVARQKEPFVVTIDDRTDFYKQGKAVNADAFRKGDQVYIVPHIMAETDLPTCAIAISDNFTDAAKALEQVSRVVHAVITDTQTVSGRIWLKTREGQTLQVYIYPMCGGPAVLGGKIPPYYVTWQFLNGRIRARLLHLSSDGTADMLDASPEPQLSTNSATLHYSRKVVRSNITKPESREWYREMHHLISFNTIQGIDHGVLLLSNSRKHELPLRATYLPGTLWYKHGQLVTAEAFVEGDKVYIAPVATEDNSPTLIAVSDSFLYAARELEKHSFLVDGVVEYWTSLQNTLIVRTKDGRRLTMSYYYPHEMPSFYSYRPVEGDHAHFRVIRLPGGGDFYYIISVKQERSGM